MKKAAKKKKKNDTQVSNVTGVRSHLFIYRPKLETMTVMTTQRLQPSYRLVINGQLLNVSGRPPDS